MTDPAAPEIDQAHYRAVLGHFPTGVTVVTATADDGPVGMAIGSFFSVSLDPPLVGFCAGKESNSWTRIREAGNFCVNVLAEDQEEVCRVFASHERDKFQGIGWKPGHTGAPVLADCLAFIDCTVDAVHDGGDHDIVVGRAQEMWAADRSGPLVFFRGGYGRFTP